MITSLATRLAPPSWVRLPRPTARLRLTIFYSALFLVSGACLLAITYLLVRHTTTGTITYNPAKRSYTYVGPHGVAGLGLGNRADRSTPQSPHLNADQSRAVAQQLRALASSQQAHELHQLLIYSAVALGIMAILSVLLGWLVAGRVLQPIRTINSTARRISAHNLHQRLALDGPDDEFTELGATLDGLLERLDTSFEAQRRFVANASHELRTPLTVERTLLQVALTDPKISVETLKITCEKLLASGAHQEQLIEALLTLASSERGLDEWEPFDLSHIVQQTLTENPLEQARRRGLQVETQIEPAPTTGDPQLAQRLISNLLDNAIRHNHDQGQITLTTGTRASRPFISVANTGPVIPETEMARLLEPFQQLENRRTGHRTGHGLGLAIIAAIAAAHHAELTVQPRPSGGLTIRATFPPQLPGTHTAPPTATPQARTRPVQTPNRRTNQQPKQSTAATKPTQ
jgi:signal transduction histidine kinase